jgi:DNA polymerase-3 subunit beta
MNIVVLQENITAALAKTSKFLPSKTSVVSSVNNFLLSAKQGAIVLTATDLETTITVLIAGKIIEEGVIILPAKPSLSLFSLFPGEKITITTEKNNIRVAGSTSNVLLKTETAESYPTEETKGKQKNLVLENTVIKNIVGKTSFSVSSDQGRAALAGILLSISKTSLSAVSTDGFRLSVFNTPITSEWERELLLPAKAVHAFLETAEEEKTVEIHYFEESKKVSVSSKKSTITTRLVEGVFPEYKKIIPTGTQTELVVDRQEMIRAVKMSSVFARESANIVRLSVKDQTMSISANAAQTGENKTDVVVKKKGEDIKTAFNYRFLLDILNALDTEQVVFESNGPLQPGVFYGGKKQEYFHIIMPVRLQESE